MFSEWTQENEKRKRKLLYNKFIEPKSGVCVVLYLMKIVAQERLDSIF